MEDHIPRHQANGGGGGALMSTAATLNKEMLVTGLTRANPPYLRPGLVLADLTLHQLESIAEIERKHYEIKKVKRSVNEEKQQTAQVKLFNHAVSYERAKLLAREQVAAERPPIKCPVLLGLSLEELLRHKFPPRRVLLTRRDEPLLRAGQLWQIFAYRGFGKTWFLETMALICAYQIQALGLRAPEPSKVLYVDGEMLSEDVQERFKLLCDMLNVPRQLGLLAKSNLTIVGSDWQEEYLPRVDTPEGQGALEPFVEPAEIIFLDGRSSLFDPEGEKDVDAWTPAQEWLLSLRKRGKAVLWSHQANRQLGSRGLGKPEDPIDVNLKLSRPADYTTDQGARFLVEFDKARSIRGAAASSFMATLGPKGWIVESTCEDSLEFKLREYLKVAKQLDESPKTAGAAVSGAKVGRTEGLKIMAKWLAEGTVVRNGKKLVLAEDSE